MSPRQPKKMPVADILDTGTGKGTRSPSGRNESTRIYVSYPITAFSRLSRHA